jgi:hypothetical protein
MALKAVHFHIPQSLSPESYQRTAQIESKLHDLAAIPDDGPNHDGLGCRKKYPGTLYFL